MTLRLNVWAPAPPPGVPDYAAEQAEALSAHVGVARVSGSEAAAPPAADLDLFHIGDSPAHGFVYRAALSRPGVVLLHDWSLHRLVLSETVERGDAATYLREMRRAHGEPGAFIARQIALGRGGELWPALYPLNHQILESSLGMVALTPTVAALATQRVRDLPVLTLPRHLSLLPEPLPTRAEARRTLGLPEGALVVTAAGLATGSSQLDVALRVVARLRTRHPQLLLVVAGAVEKDLPLEEWARDSGIGEGPLVTGPLGPEDFTGHLVAADIVLALRFPSDGGMPEAVVKALAVGRPVLVTAGTPAGEAFPEGVVVPVDPGHDGVFLDALLSRLVEDAGLRESLGRTARAHVLAHHGRADTARALADFLQRVFHDRDRLRNAAASRRPAEGTLDARLLDEVRATAHDLGLGGLSLGIEDFPKK